MHAIVTTYHPAKYMPAVKDARYTANVCRVSYSVLDSGQHVPGFASVLLATCGSATPEWCGVTDKISASDVQVYGKYNASRQGQSGRSLRGDAIAT